MVSPSIRSNYKLPPASPHPVSWASPHPYFRAPPASPPPPFPRMFPPCPCHTLSRAHAKTVPHTHSLSPIPPFPSMAVRGARLPGAPAARRTPLLAPLALLALVLPVALSANITVSPSGTDSPSCGLAPSEACATVQRAAERAAEEGAGEVLLEPGTYRGALLVDEGVVVVRGGETDSVVIEPPEGWEEEHALIRVRRRAGRAGKREGGAVRENRTFFNPDPKLTLNATSNRSQTEPRSPFRGSPCAEAAGRRSR